MRRLNIKESQIRDQLILAAKVESIPRFREFADEVCGRSGADDDECFALKLAVDEVCTNIVEHGYGPGVEGEIAVAIEADDSEIRVMVRDTGRSFSPDDVVPPELDLHWSERPVGGLGWHLVRNAVDEVRYQRDGRENRLVLVKKLRGHGEKNGSRRWKSR